MEERRRVNVRMPALGPTSSRGTIACWRKREGDLVRNGEALADIVTDEVTLKVEAPVSGVLLRRSYYARSAVPVGAIIALIEPVDEALVFAPRPTAEFIRQQNITRALRIGLAVLLVPTLVIALVFFLAGNPHKTDAVLVIAYILLALYEVLRFLASFMIWLKKRRARPAPAD